MMFRKRKPPRKAESLARKGFVFEWLELETRVLPSVSCTGPHQYHPL